MTTQETINGKKVSIEWEFIDIQDRHDSNWCEWTVSGTDDDGNLYFGSCQADGSHPYDMHDKVTDIEKVNLKQKAMNNESTLLMPFLDESESFVHGFECGKLWNLMEEGECVERYLIHVANVKQVELMTETFGITSDIEIIDDTWAYLSIKSTVV